MSVKQYNPLDNLEDLELLPVQYFRECAFCDNFDVKSVEIKPSDYDIKKEEICYCEECKYKYRYLTTC